MEMQRIARTIGLAILTLLVAAAAGAAPVSPSCSGCQSFRQPCTLLYGASGEVVDKLTGQPIVGATITVLDVQGVSGEDGSFHVEGSRPDTCYLDYFYSFSVSAPGYEGYSQSYYANYVFPTLTVELDPVGSRTPTPCIQTPPNCGHGEVARPCLPEICEGCGCEPCPPCPEGQRLAPGDGHCNCVPDIVVPPTPTVTPEPSEVGSPAATPAPCEGDCNDDGAVGIEELIGAVREALGGSPPQGCQTFDRDRSGGVGVDELVALVSTALRGCE